MIADLVFRFLEESAGLDGGQEATDSVLRRLCNEHPESATRLREAVRALARGGWMEGDEARVIPPEISGFDVGERLGAGGMGVVYEATRHADGASCAIKVLRGHHPAGTDRARRFAREVEALGRLDHPGIVACLGSGEVDGPDGPAPFLVMELVEGVGLDRWLRSAEPGAPPVLPGETPPEDAHWRVGARLLAGMARALAHAHVSGVIHRDLKTANVILTPSGRPMLLDFGLASIDGWRRLTDTNSHMGSLPYMSPEQVRGVQGLTPASDLYSLGVIAHELLSLRHPFAEVERNGLPGAITNRPPALLRISDASAETVARLRRIVTALLAKDPEDRPASATEVAEAFESVLAGQEPSLRQRSRSARLWSAVSTRPRHFVGGAGLFLIIVGAGWFLIGSGVGKEGPTASDLAAAEGRALLAGLKSGLGGLETLDLAGLDPARAEDEVEQLQEVLALLDASREAPGGEVRHGELRELEADLLMALGARLTARGKHAEALEVHRKQVESVDALASGTPGLSRYRPERARARVMLARAQLEATPGPIPLDDLEAACAAFFELVAQEGASPLLRSQAGGAAAVLSSAYWRARRDDNAREEHERATGLWRGLLTEPGYEASARLTLAELALSRFVHRTQDDGADGELALRNALGHIDASGVRVDRSMRAGLLRIEILGVLAIELCDRGAAEEAELLAEEADVLARQLIGESGAPGAVDDPVARAAKRAASDLAYIRLQRGDDEAIRSLRAAWRQYQLAAERTTPRDAPRTWLEFSMASSNLGNQLVLPAAPGPKNVEEALRVIAMGLDAAEALPETLQHVEQVRVNLRYSRGLAWVRAKDAEQALEQVHGLRTAIDPKNALHLLQVADLAAEVAGIAEHTDRRGVAVDLALTALEERAALGVPLEEDVAGGPAFQVLVGEPRWGVLTEDHGAPESRGR